MDLYFKKKEQLNLSQKVAISDVSVEIEKKRSGSPVPQVRSSSIVANDKKVVYKGELEDHKNIIVSKQEEINSRLLQLEQLHENLSNEIKKNIDEIKRNMENSKVDNLKNTLNEAIKQQNNNIDKISDELIKHLDNINSLKSDVEQIKDIL